MESERVLQALRTEHRTSVMELTARVEDLEAAARREKKAVAEGVERLKELEREVGRRSGVNQTLLIISKNPIRIVTCSNY